MTFTIEEITEAFGVNQRKNGEWFVMALSHENDGSWWSQHCGPYSTREQAVEWIHALAPAQEGTT